MGLLDIFKGDKKKKAPEPTANPNSATGDSGLVHSPLGAPQAAPAAPQAPGAPQAPAAPQAAMQAPQLEVPQGMPMAPEMPQAQPLPDIPQPDMLLAGPPDSSLPELGAAAPLDLNPGLPSDDKLAGYVGQMGTEAPHPYDSATVDRFAHLMDSASVDIQTDSLDAPMPLDAPPAMDAPPALDATPALEVPSPLDTMDAPPAPESEPMNLGAEPSLPDLPEVPKWDAQPQIDAAPLPAIEDVAQDTGIPSAIPDLELFDTDDELMAQPQKEDPFKKLQSDLKNLNKPLFVKMDDFAHIVDSINAVNATLRDSDKIFYRLKELKEIREKKLDGWRKSLEEIQRKLVYLDNKVFEVL